MAVAAMMEQQPQPPSPSSPSFRQPAAVYAHDYAQPQSQPQNQLHSQFNGSAGRPGVVSLKANESDVSLPSARSPSGSASIASSSAETETAPGSLSSPLKPPVLSKKLSASSLKERLSKLSTIQNPVATLHANVKFVPAHIPRKRRFQMLAVALWSCSVPIMTSVFFFLCSFPPLWPILAAYMIWALWIDQGPENGGRSSHWVRSSRFWRYFADYYPASFLKEAELPPDRPYVFGYHPHGIIGMGALATFATEATGFSAAFPGIKPHLLTLTTNFNVPLYRDIILALGISSVSKRSCSNILKAGPGSAITIVVGGAAESLSARPGTADLTLRKRLGFIKVAIQHGADLVPVFSFGENDIYEQMPNEKGTTVYTLQKKFQLIFGFTLPLFHGRGVLNYNLGLMPYRRRIVAVIGKPIHVEKCDKPSLEEVMRIQQLYIEELTRIWNTYKNEFAKSRLRELSIVD